MPRTVSTLARFLALASLACSPAVSSPPDSATACTDLCTTSGFASGRAEVFEHELNCFCEGGSAAARVPAAACTQTCTDLGWRAGTAFSASACQCD